VSLALAPVSGLMISGGLMLADGIAGAGLTISGKVLSIAPADTSLTVNADSLQVRLATTSGLAISSGLMIADSVAGDGLDIASKVLAVDVTDIIDTNYGLTENSNNIRISLATNSGLMFSTGALTMGTPGTLSVSSADARAGSSHTHAITSSSNPGAAAAILASNASGYVQLTGLGIGTAATSDHGVIIAPTFSSGTSYGVEVEPVVSGSFATMQSQRVGIRVLDGTTLTSWYGLNIGTPTLEGSGTISTNVIAFRIGDQSSVGIPSTYALLQIGPTDYNLFLGLVGIGPNVNYTTTEARLNISDTSTQLQLLYNGSDTTAARWTVDSSGYLTLDVDGNQFRLAPDVRIQSDNYASQTTGWATSYAGGGDFRYLFVDELHAKTFIADLEQALAGGQIISKSVAILYSDFVCPAAGGVEYIYVEDLPGAPNMEVYQSGDYVGLRQFTRAGGGLTIAWCWGIVTFPNTSFDGYQGWQFTRLSGTTGGLPNAGSATGTIAKGTLVLDFGVSGNGYYEVNAIDGAYAENSPYAQVVTWGSHPWLDRTVRARYGNLKGITSSDEYGFYAGNSLDDEILINTEQWLRITDQNIDIHNIDLSIHDGTREVIRLDHDDGISVWSSDDGTPVMRVYSGATSVAWADLTLYPGDAMLGNASSAFVFDKSLSTIYLGDVSAGHYLKATSSYTSIYYSAVERARYATNITLWDPDGQTRFSVTNDGNITIYDHLGADRFVAGSSGVYVGDTTEGEYLFISSAGIDFYGGGVQHGDILSSGNWWFGDTATTERIQWDSANGLNIYNASNVAVIRAPISGAAGIVGTLSVTGEVTAGAGVVSLSSTGITIVASASTETITNALQIEDSVGNHIGRLSAYTGVSSTNAIVLRAVDAGGRDAFLWLVSETSAMFSVLLGSSVSLDSDGCTIQVGGHNAATNLTIMGDVVIDDADLTIGRGLKIGTTSLTPLSGQAAIAESFIESEAIACTVYRSTAQTIGHASWTAIAFDGEVRDTYAMHSTVTNTTRITITWSGFYLITGSFAWVANAAGARGVAVRLNGTTFLAAEDKPAAQDLMSIAVLYYVTAGQYVELCAYQDTGGNLNIDPISAYSPYFSVARQV
jgi:hypothetical protein